MTAADVQARVRSEFHRGDRVRLKSVDEIVGTLDADGTLDRLPFMREMLQFAGRDLTVAARADKTCDTIDMTGPNRRMTGTVHIVGARCDGSAHGGCQAYCNLFFKEAWLEPAPPAEETGRPELDGPELDGPELDGPELDGPELDGPDAGLADRPISAPSVVQRDTLPMEGVDEFAVTGADTYRCQATELIRASSPLTGRSHYLRDVLTRNVPISTILRAIPYAVVNRYQRASMKLPAALRLFDGHRLPRVRGGVVDRQWPPTEPLDLQPGDLVEVRSREEIEATLDSNQKNRGLWFDEEMLAYCGHQGRVRHRVERLIDEKTGRMLRITRDLVVIEGMSGCAGLYHSLCPRSVIAMWREAWLRKID
ncbi:hypothetical protein GCM10027053_03200 [Intrasporangium mesophilum]